MNENLSQNTPIIRQIVRFYRCKLCFGFVESLDSLVAHWVIGHGIKVNRPPEASELNYNSANSVTSQKNSTDSKTSLESIDKEVNDIKLPLSDFKITNENLSKKSIKRNVKRKATLQISKTTNIIKKEAENGEFLTNEDEDYETQESESELDQKKELFGSFADLKLNKRGKQIVTKRSARLLSKMNLNINQNNSTGMTMNGVWTPGTDASLYLSLPSPSEILSESPSGDSSFGCPICNIQFQTRSQLMGHTRKHMKDKLFQCKLCEQNFPTHKELKSHMGDKTETDEFSITCGICSRTFPSQACLTHHLNCHKQAGSAPVIIDNPSAERRYSCSLCSKTFKNSQHVQRHLRIHTGEKPFSCDLCGQSFSLNHNLQRHMRTHTGEKPHKCPVCAKEFAEGHNLKRHMISAHDGPTPYVCTICNRKFAENSILRKHQNKSHKQTNNSSQ